MKPEIYRLISRFSTDNDIDPVLVAAVVKQESGGVCTATRYEPNYKWLYPREKPPADWIEVEQQKTSWGLMQLMGALIRECGCQDYYLWDFLYPAKNLELGCKHLKKLLVKHGDSALALQAYNAGIPGTSQGIKYSQQVMARMPDEKRVLDMINFG